MSDEPNNTPEGWYADPWDPRQLRYWDGTTWTKQTTGTRRTFLGLWGSSANDTFAAGASGMGFDGDGFDQATADALPARVLVRCCERAETVWNPDFTAYAPETVAWLAAQGVRLIGLDTPSVDPASSKTLDSHQQLLRLNLRVLENLVLDDVPEGDYELIALPLKLTTADASPVRAVLREL